MASLTLATLSLLLLWSFAQSQQPNNDTPSTSLTSTTTTGNDDHPQYTEIVPIRWNKYTIIATVTAAIAVIAGIVASASILLPLITYKICYLFGACGTTIDTTEADRFDQEYLDFPVYNPNGAAAPVSNVRQKRSIEQLGPIIQTLAAAYEKYENHGQDAKKNFAETAMHMFFTK